VSVILYEEEKFLRTYQSLKLMGRDIAHVFRYPKGWNEPDKMDEVIKSFVADLKRANISTWNRQYPDDPKSLAIPDFDQGILPYGNDLELLKSLKGLHYNLISNDGQETNLLGCYEKLRSLIYYIMSTIINRLPLYQKARTW